MDLLDCRFFNMRQDTVLRAPFAHLNHGQIPFCFVVLMFCLKATRDCDKSTRGHVAKSYRLLFRLLL